MNIRLANQQIRLRVTASELQTLLALRSLQTTVTFPYGTHLIFHVVPHDALKAPFSIKCSEAYWALPFFFSKKYHFYLNVSKTVLLELNRKMPSKEGVHATLENGEKEALEVVLEVDVKKLHS